MSASIEIISWSISCISENYKYLLTVPKSECKCSSCPYFRRASIIDCMQWVANLHRYYDFRIGFRLNRFGLYQNFAVILEYIYRTLFTIVQINVQWMIERCKMFNCNRQQLKFNQQINECQLKLMLLDSLNQLHSDDRNVQEFPHDRTNFGFNIVDFKRFQTCFPFKKNLTFLIWTEKNDTNWMVTVHVTWFMLCENSICT